MTMTGEPRKLEELSPRESMRLLGTVSLGRVAFSTIATGQDAVTPSA